MSLCINPHCPNPQNADNLLFCQACGSELLLEGRYRVIRPLGGGGFGKTYEVSDYNSAKVLKILINNSPKAVELFQREAEVLSQLNYPGIPRVEPNGYFIFHPKDSQQPLHCLVMEKIEGHNLREYIKQKGQPIKNDVAVRWLTELVNTLHQVHSQGIFHRDIKPQNIMLKPDGKLSLIDFGAVKEGGETEAGTQGTGTATGVGTQTATHAGGGGTSIRSTGYTPIEQINGQAVLQSDFFALGRTLVYLLTAKEPTDKDMYDAFNDEFRWRNYAPDVSPQLADLIDNMMARSASQRPANTQVILQRLAEAEKLDAKQVISPPVRLPQPPVPPLQPEPQPSATPKQVPRLVAAGILAGFIGVVFALPGLLKAFNSIPPQPTSPADTSSAARSPSAAPNSSPNSDAASNKPYDYTSSDGNYTAKFPGKPSEQPRSTDSPQGKVSGAEVRYVDQAKQQLYLTGHVNLPIAHGTKLTDANIQQILNNGRDSMVKTSGATIKNETPISQNGFPGKEFVMTLPNGTAVKARIYINPNNKRAYQVIVSAKDGNVDSNEFNTFLDSMVIEQ